MKKICILILWCLISGITHAQRANYDEAKVGQYTLPDALLTHDGNKVDNRKMWEKVRRPEIMKLLADVEYGTLPDVPVKTAWKVLEESDDAMGGKAVRRQVQFTFSNNGVNRTMLLLVYMPKGKKKCPVFVSPNFHGNQSTTEDLTVIKSQYSKYERGEQKSRWAYEKILNAGYAVATFHYFDLFYDEEKHIREGIMPVFGINTDADFKPHTGKSISAWAWGCSRVLDYLLTLKNIDKKRCIVMGHSRLGKTALWAGAQDKRFAMVVSNNSGCCGAALSRRNFGETVPAITKNFPRWFCNTYFTYANRVNELPFDQHELLAMIAPRPLYVASAEEDRWADPRGEFLSLKEAGKVYALYGLETFADAQFPAVGEYVWHGNMGYHMRSGKHDVTDFDWEAYIRFANQKLY